MIVIDAAEADVEASAQAGCGGRAIATAQAILGRTAVIVSDGAKL